MNPPLPNSLGLSSRCDKGVNGGVKLCAGQDSGGRVILQGEGAEKGNELYLVSSEMQCARVMNSNEGLREHTHMTSAVDGGEGSQQRRRNN